MELFPRLRLNHESSQDGTGSPGLAWLFAVCGGLYLSIYAFESPIRYILYLGGKDGFILARDALIFLPIAALAVQQANRMRLHPALVAFGVLVAFHGLILCATVGTPTAVAYGVKILANILFGYFAASLLITPGNRMLKLLALLWIATLVGVLLDKFVTTFPWVGIKTVVGDLTVDVSKDWQIQDTFSRRVAGFARSSISVAVLMPVLGILLMGRTRQILVRCMIGLASLAAVFLTTQKGSLIAFLPVAAIMMARPRQERLLLQVWGLLAALLMVLLPVLTTGMDIDHGTGVFSTQSLYLRIHDTWPRAWDWIGRHQMLVFGVGLGGIGGPQRLYAIDNFNPADNFFVLLYAYFGVFGLLYLGLLLWLLVQPARSERPAATATALIAFLLGYGAVLSIIEDQIAALMLGAGIGLLLQERARAVPQAAGSVHLQEPRNLAAHATG